MIYGSQNFAVTFPGILGTAEGAEGFGRGKGSGVLSGPRPG